MSKPDSQTTIKEHLEEIKNLVNGTIADEFFEEICAVIEHLSAIEAKLDAPMKSAEEWYNEQYFSHRSKDELCELIRAIQSDAIASKLPAVDLRGLAEETASKLRGKFGAHEHDIYGNPIPDIKYNEEVIYSLLKSIGVAI